MRIVRALSLVAVAAAALAPAAHAGPILDRTAEALAADPVYVDENAERAITDADAERLREQIASADAGPMYIAILPAEARNETGGSTEGFLRALHDRLGREGTYAVVVGRQFRAGATPRVLEEGVAPRLADEAIDEHGPEGVAPTLLAFVTAVGEARGGGEGAAGDAEAARGGEEERGGGIPGWVILGVGAGGLGLFFLSRRRRQQQADTTELAEVKQEAQTDLLALAEDIRALDLDVEMPGADPRAKEDYAAAVAAYQRADTALDRARRPQELEAIGAALEEGRYAMESAKARLAGREPPDRRPPCFFDPRHGPSVADVEWAPPGGAPRPVPACAADAQAVERGLEPASREVLVGGERVPYWAAPPVFAPWAGGYFGAFGGLFPGILIGSMLGGGIFAPPALGGGETGGFDDPGGGDFGDFGGDFGGGDFGGGDFGGGDFGGGD